MKAANEATAAESPAAVTVDTLKAAKQLRSSGFDDQQADAIVTTISTAMSETVATKADLKLLRADLELLRQSVDSRFERMELKLEALEDKIVIKLGALIVTMTFLLLAIGPFYFRWVYSLISSM